MRFAFALLLLPSVAVAADPAPWATYRGNPARTGNTDGMPGPDKPAVLWVRKAEDHFVASPVPSGENLLLSAFGAFNRPMVSLVPGKTDGPAVWSRSAPYLRFATVSSPAVAGKFVPFGDGLHTDPGGSLHCLTADTGRPVWQLPLPGELIHLEGAPTVTDGRVYMGGGAAGAFCVELNRALLDDKEVTAEEVAKLQEAKWKELLAKFEEQKKKDPDFAVPPTEDQLLKPSPKRVWQAGEKKWHVDAPVNVVGGKVLVGTSFLDKEKAGERALYCLDAKTGGKLWSEKLTYNPWGGASISGDTVVVCGSSVGLYVNELKGAKGDITALDLHTGKVKWRKDVPGGVVACAAVADGLAVVTATDGKVRAYALADGDRKWFYDAKAAFFAPPAVAGGVVYAADLNGVVHALNLKDGVPKWKFDLGTELKSPGMVYGGVVVHNGKLFVATANFEGPHARKGTCVVCLGAK